MAYSQLGYSYATAPQFLMASSPLGACLESATPPSHAVLRSTGHQLTPGTGIGVYSGPYPKSQGYYSSCPSDATALYSRVSALCSVFLLWSEQIIMFSADGYKHS